ncbi:MAG: hypothetical protein KC931_23765, partial [Candidatus Omnitrophica bacterium]|nr:hypothetical protein [Candidatus Omnitrophota bacterium]
SSHYPVEPSGRVRLRLGNSARSGTIGLILEGRKEDGSVRPIQPTVAIEDAGGGKVSLVLNPRESSLGENGVTWEENGADAAIWYAFEGTFPDCEIRSVEFENPHTFPLTLISIWFEISAELPPDPSSR